MDVASKSPYLPELALLLIILLDGMNFPKKALVSLLKNCIGIVHSYSI